MLLLFARFQQRVDNVAKYMQRLVDATALPKSLTLHIGMLDSLAACEVDDTDL